MKKVERKINEGELTSLQSKLSEINDVKKRIGEIEIQKHSMQPHFVTLEHEFKTLQKDLREKYGDVSMNINDGSSKEVENEANT